MPKPGGEPADLVLRLAVGQGRERRAAHADRPWSPRQPWGTASERARNHRRHRSSARRRASARREGRTERHALPVTARGSAVTPSGCPSRSARHQPNIKDCPSALSSADPCDRGTPCASECFERSDFQGRMDQDAGTLAGSGYQKVNAPPPGGRGSCRASAERWPAPVCPRRRVAGHRSSSAVPGRSPAVLGGAWPVTGRPRRCLVGPGCPRRCVAGHQSTSAVVRGSRRRVPSRPTRDRAGQRRTANGRRQAAGQGERLERVKGIEPSTRSLGSL